MDAIDSRRIRFDTGSTELTDEARDILDQIAVVLKDYPDAPITIAGYTDSVGLAENNLDLSQRRADSVRRYLVEIGIPSDQLRSYGYGELAPIADNGTPEGRATNRRIEFNF